MDITSTSVFINKDGHTVKIQKIDYTNATITYTIDGGNVEKTDKSDLVEKMLELGGYKDVAQTISGFFMSSSRPSPWTLPKVGDNIRSQNWKYEAEVIRIDGRGIHVQFSARSTSPMAGTGSAGFGPAVTTYIYDEKDFKLIDIFTPELIKELDEKCGRNVFEVIGVNSKNEEVKFTIIGQSINKELLEKINMTYSSLAIYSIKRLTAINIQ